MIERQEDNKEQYIRTIFNQEICVFGLQEWDHKMVFMNKAPLKKGYQTLVGLKETEERMPPIYFDADYKNKEVTIFVINSLLDQELKDCERTMPGESEEEKLRTFADHEIAHLIINPNPTVTGGGTDHARVQQITRACHLLRTKKIKIDYWEDNNVTKLLDKSLELTWLTENDWRVRVEEKRNIRVDGKRLPAYAYSTYHDKNTGWASIGAREFILQLDHEEIRKQHIQLEDAILKECWRIVLNPYARPDDQSYDLQEKKLKHIMMAMNTLGWRKLPPIVNPDDGLYVVEGKNVKVNPEELFHRLEEMEEMAKIHPEYQDVVDEIIKQWMGAINK